MQTRELSKKVRILNPIEKWSDITSRRQAERYVQAGRAVFVGQNRIQFIAGHPHNLAAKEHAANLKYDAATKRLATQTEIANVPFARPGVAFREAITDRTKIRVRRCAGRNGKVEILMSAGLQHGT
jgi:hypothetical protein